MRSSSARAARTSSASSPSDTPSLSPMARRQTSRMQRRVVLVRHAKTEQGFPDLERVLTGRGRRDAAEIGRWLEAQRIAPDLVVVSPATRAKQTWELAAAELDGDPPTEVDDRVYTNSVEALLEIVR